MELIKFMNNLFDLNPGPGWHPSIAEYKPELQDIVDWAAHYYVNSEQDDSVGVPYVFGAQVINDTQEFAVRIVDFRKNQNKLGFSQSSAYIHNIVVSKCRKLINDGDDVLQDGCEGDVVWTFGRAAIGNCVADLYYIDVCVPLYEEELKETLPPVNGKLVKSLVESYAEEWNLATVKPDGQMYPKFMRYNRMYYTCKRYIVRGDEYQEYGELKPFVTVDGILYHVNCIIRNRKDDTGDRRYLVNQLGLFESLQYGIPTNHVYTFSNYMSKVQLCDIHTFENKDTRTKWAK